MSDIINHLLGAVMMMIPVGGSSPYETMPSAPPAAYVQCDLSGDRGALVNLTLVQTGDPKFLAEYSVAVGDGPMVIHPPGRQPIWAFEQIGENAGRASNPPYALTMNKQGGNIARAWFHRGIVEIGRGSCRHYDPRRYP